VVLRERDCEPVSHDLVHVVHGFHAFTTQFFGQLCLLHERVSDRYGHRYPPWRAANTIERERDCWPVPQDLVQVVQALKALVMQCTGHGPWLQTWVSAVCGQAAPPFNGCTTRRERRCEPLPHDLVQVLQAVQPFTMQSRGQVWLLHERVSV